MTSSVLFVRERKEIGFIALMTEVVIESLALQEHDPVIRLVTHELFLVLVQRLFISTGLIWESFAADCRPSLLVDWESTQISCLCFEFHYC